MALSSGVLAAACQRCDVMDLHTDPLEPAAHTTTARRQDHRLFPVRFRESHLCPATATDFLIEPTSVAHSHRRIAGGRRSGARGELRSGVRFAVANRCRFRGWPRVRDLGGQWRRVVSVNLAGVSRPSSLRPFEPIRPIGERAGSNPPVRVPRPCRSDRDRRRISARSRESARPCRPVRPVP